MEKNGVQHALSALWRGLSIVQLSACKKICAVLLFVALKECFSHKYFLTLQPLTL